MVFLKFVLFLMVMTIIAVAATSVTKGKAAPFLARCIAFVLIALLIWHTKNVCSLLYAALLLLISIGYVVAFGMCNIAKKSDETANIIFRNGFLKKGEK